MTLWHKLKWPLQIAPWFCAKTYSGLVKEVTQDESVSRATQSCTCALSDLALRLLSLTGCSLLSTRSLFLKNNTKQQMAQNRRAAILVHFLTLDSNKYWQVTTHNHYLWCTSDAARWPVAKTAASWNVLHSSSQAFLHLLLEWWSNVNLTMRLASYVGSIWQHLTLVGWWDLSNRVRNKG